MLICLKPGKSKAFCENKACKVQLIGKFKILRRGEHGYAFHVCLSCFNVIIKKGGPDKYLPGAKDASTGADLHEVTEKPYAPIGTHKLKGSVKVLTNHRTGQIFV